MKNIKSALLIFLTIITYNCKAQQIPESQYSTNIVGTWVLEEDTNNKLVFTTNGQCKVYVGNQLDTTYEYSFENNVCQNYTENNVVYLKWREVNTLEFTCVEISGMTTDILSLMLIDSAQILYYNRQ